MTRSAASTKNQEEYPEFVVTREAFNRYFEKSLPTSTFHDFVNKGKIIPMKGIRGFYLLNASLRRLGLREVPKLPEEIPARTPEEIIRLAFCMMDPEVFEAPSWLLNVDAINAADLHHAELIIGLHSGPLADIDHERLKQGYLQGVLDAAAITAADRATAG